MIKDKVISNRWIILDNEEIYKIKFVRKVYFCFMKYIQELNLQ